MKSGINSLGDLLDFLVELSKLKLPKPKLTRGTDNIKDDEGNIQEITTEYLPDDLVFFFLI